MATKKTVKKKVQYLGTGRRKTAIARVRLIPGEGNITINKRAFEDYFPLDTMRLIVNQPLEAVSATDKFDVIVNVHGGGMTGQAGAIRHGIARALCVCDREAYRSILKKAGVDLTSKAPFETAMKEFEDTLNEFEKLTD